MEPTPTYTGYAFDTPFVSPTETDVTINFITSVEFRVDGGPWQLASATDGAFDEDVEDFQFTPILASGTHTIQVRATNTVGNISAIVSDTLTILGNAVPAVSINDVSIVEGNAGTINAVFTVALSSASAQTITVNYSTVNGTAAAGSDYVAQSGTVTFSAGQTTKTIAVLVMGDTVVEPNETFFVNLTSASNAVIADGQGAGTIINHVPGILDNNNFVRQQYLDFLDREADAGGLFSGITQLNNGLPRANLIEFFLNSEEFRFKGKFIAQSYLGILTRDADYDGFRGWLGILLAGVSPEQIVQAFFDSGEFQSRFGSNLTNGQFVETMYNNILLRSSDPGGFNGWAQALNSGQVTRAQVALSFLDSDEFQNLSASQNRVDISLLYFDMLRRDPDPGGFSGWVGVLNSGVPLISVIEAFLNSSEYQARF